MLRAAALPCLALIATACGEPDSRAEIRLAQQEAPPACAIPSGEYKATFTLRDTQGTCDSAKLESHDPMDFDGRGHYLSPVGDLVACRTIQDDCHLSVHCSSDAMSDASADLDAQLAPDGSAIIGTGTVVGSYQGCTRVVYDVVAYRKE